MIVIAGAPHYILRFINIRLISAPGRMGRFFFGASSRFISVSAPASLSMPSAGRGTHQSGSSRRR
jgi:hypothetical protein